MTVTERPAAQRSVIWRLWIAGPGPPLVLGQRRAVSASASPQPTAPARRPAPRSRPPRPPGSTSHTGTSRPWARNDADVAGAVAERVRAARVQPGERVEHRVLVVRHHPAQVRLARGCGTSTPRRPSSAAPSARRRRWPRSSGSRRLGVVARRLPSIQKSKPSCTVTSNGASRSSRSCSRGPAAGRPSGRPACPARPRAPARSACADVAAGVAGGRDGLQAEEDLAVAAHQRGPGHRQDRRDRDGAAGVRAGERSTRRGRGRDDLAQRDPVALAGQPLERAAHQRATRRAPARGRGRTCSACPNRTGTARVRRRRGLHSRRRAGPRRDRTLSALRRACGRACSRLGAHRGAPSCRGAASDAAAPT